MGFFGKIRDSVRHALGRVGQKFGGIASRFGSKMSKIGAIGSLASLPLMATGVGEIMAPAMGITYGIGKVSNWIGSALK